jgi:ribosome-associated translation inhibitor RaiA
LLISAISLEYDTRTQSVNETNVSESPDNKKQNDFIKLAQLVNGKTAKLDENNFSFGLNNGKAITFNYSEEKNIVTTTYDNLIIENNDFERFVIGAKTDWQFQQLIPYFRLMVENLGSFIHFDNAQLLEVKNYDNTGVIIFKNANNKLSLYKSNPAMHESKMLNKLNSLQTINYVREFLNIDITQSLREMVEVEANTIQVIDSDLKALSEAILLMEKNLQRVNMGLNDSMYKEINESLEDLSISMNSELSELKQKYNKLSVKRQNLLSVNENNIDSFSRHKTDFPEHTDANEYDKLEGDENPFNTYDSLGDRDIDDDSIEYFTKRPTASNKNELAPEEELGDNEVEIEVDSMYPGESVVHRESNSVGQIVSIDYTNGIAIVDFNGDVEMKEVPIESLELADRD